MPESNPPWTVTIPLDALVALQTLPERVNQLEEVNVQLRRELEALRCNQSRTLIKLGDLMRGA